MKIKKNVSTDSPPGMLLLPWPVQRMILKSKYASKTLGDMTKYRWRKEVMTIGVNDAFPSTNGKFFLKDLQGHLAPKLNVSERTIRRWFFKPMPTLGNEAPDGRDRIVDRKRVLEVLYKKARLKDD